MSIEGVMRLIKAVRVYHSIYGDRSVYLRRNRANEGYYVGLPMHKEYAQNLSLEQAAEMLERYTMPTTG